MSNVPDILQPHFSTNDLADAWQLDRGTIARIFQDEAGVIRIGRTAVRGGKRPYCTIRIPKSVAERVYRERLAK